MWDLLDSSGPDLLALTSRGGCASKLPKAKLAELIGHSRLRGPFLDIGAIPGTDGLVMSTDFGTPTWFNPICWGELAAVNVLSDIMAAIAEPLAANVVVGLPGELHLDVGVAAYRSLKRTLEHHGALVVGGHTMQSPIPFLGATVVARRSSRLTTAHRPEAGDKVFLSKPLGSGIGITALKFGERDAALLEELYLGMSRLDSLAVLLEGRVAHAALTDVSGFGLANHLVQLLDAEDLSCLLEASRLPSYGIADEWLQRGLTLPMADANLLAFEARHSISILTNERARSLALLTDPQTCGGLLCIAPNSLGPRLVAGGWSSIGRLVKRASTDIIVD